MDPWMPRNIVFLVLLCGAGGQISTRPLWRPPWLERLTTRDRVSLVPLAPQPKVSSGARFTLLGPDLLRADSPENLFLQANGISSPVTVQISIQDFAKTTTLLTDSVTLSSTNGFHALKTIQLSSAFLNRGEKKNKFVYLKVKFDNHYTEERVLMVSFHSGYIFIQTDKPIYNPGETVKFRVFVSSPSFKAIDSSLTIDFKSPDGVVVKQISRTKTVDGIFADSFPLSEIVSEGPWTIIAMFDHWPQNKFTSRFEVKKYVLPAFNVTLTPRKSYLDLDDRELVVEISARYLFGEPVQGTAYVVFGVKINEEMIRLPSVKQVSNLEGGVVSLSMEEIKRVYPNIRTLVGNSVYVKASVLTKSGSDLVEAEKTGIKIVESPYVISFKDMTNFFKPGLPFDFTIQLSHHDGSLVRNIPVKVNLLEKPLDMSTGSTRVSINMPSATRLQTITAETIQANLRPEQQARHQVNIHAYNTPDRRRQNYLYISKMVERVYVGDSLSLKLTVQTADLADRDLIEQITYLVLNKGKIISAQRVDVTGHFITSVLLQVTPEMLPSFRFVAFYSIPWTRREEVVSDSIWIDVVDSCAGGGLTVGLMGRVQRDYTPGKNILLQVRGDPGANVNLVAVDNAVYLLNKDRLTQEKIWDVVEQGDIGCNRGGGRDAGYVFSNAGLLFLSSAGFKTRTRQTLQCTGRARRRRSAEQLRHKALLENHYKEKLQHRCCKDGLRDIPMPYSCTRRSLYITEGWECIQAFRYCCATYRNQEINTEIPTTPPPPTTTSAPFTTPRPRPSFPSLMAYARVNSYSRMSDVTYHAKLPVAKEAVRFETSYLRTLDDYTTPEFVEDDEEEEWEYADESDVYLRSKFLESWLWIDLKLPTQAEEDGLASTEVNSVLPDSITEWGIMAISSSPQTGFCVAKPYNVKTWKHFFVDLKLPHSVARNEQLEIKAVIHNYGSKDLHVMVVLMRTENMCSVAFKDRHTQEVTVPVGSSVVVPYTIIPFVVGKLPLDVMVLARDNLGSDRVQKSLRVVLDGVQKTEVWSVVLNPSAEGGEQRVRMGKVELKSVVPNSWPETFINIRGNVLADSIDNSISDDSLASLIRMPGGCVEQNLASITLPLIATLYLETTNNWESVGVERKADALRYIKRGYENQLAYKKTDGSYPPYRKEGASTWITAYVVKVFSMAHSIIGVNEQQVCDPLLYLVQNKINIFTGLYVEDNPVYSTTMTGGLRGDDPIVTLSAFVLIALAEAKQAGITCSDLNMNINIKMRRTADHLKKAVTRPGRRPYTVAIAAYALAMMGEPKRYNTISQLMRAAAPDRTHWPDSQNALFTLEATGYALLALVKLGHMEEAAAPFKWLNSQRRKGGGFGSTQSTMVVFQALSEYLIHKPPPADVNLNVDLQISGRREIRYNFNPKTSYTARSSRLPADLDFQLVARGNGQGILEVVTYYNQLQEVDEKIPCRHFELSVAIEESSEKPPADVEKSFQITIKVRALGPRDVRMVILDVSLPTGFTPENSDLEMLSNSVDRYINNFKIVDNLSDRGSLILHLFKVSHKEPEILTFRLQQNFKVGVIQPSSVTVYEYYIPDHRCSRTYTPSEDRETLTHICRNNTCRCAHGDCCVSKTDSETFSNKQRETFACKSLHHVYKVKVLGITQSYYDTYEMEITQVIKLGVESGVSVGQRRLFMSNGGCRDGLNLSQGSQYLIIGPKEDQWNIDSENNRFIYMLGKDTWVERWPTPAECSSNPSLQAKCKTLDDAAYDLSVNSCWL